MHPVHHVRRRRPAAVLLAMALLASAAVRGRADDRIAGDWHGRLSALRLVMHFEVSESGLGGSVEP